MNGHSAPSLLSNNASHGWVVQKFGGTSVGKFASQIAQEIVAKHIQDSRLVLVCSARSADTKAEGTTNRLIKACKESEKLPKTNEYKKLVQVIQQDHNDAAALLIKDASILAKLKLDIAEACVFLNGLLGAAQFLQEVSPKTLDNVLATGEKLSCLLMAALLNDRGIDAEYVGMEDVIGEYDAANGLDQKFYDFVCERMARRIEACGNRVPVVTGYFGVVPGSLLAMIGRGYTDLCAALIAIGLKAEELQVWKEVDGIFTADPRKVPTARLLPRITPEEAAELTYYGSEVIHPFISNLVVRARIPIRIKNVENPTGAGTVIFPDADTRSGSATPINVPHKNPLETIKMGKTPTAVTIKDDIIILAVESNRKVVSHGFFAQVFGILDKWKLTVDLISTSEVHVSMAINVNVKLAALKGVEDDLRKVGVVVRKKDMAILSLVGKQMKNMIGVSGKMFSTLAQAGINIEMISQGASEINISCVISERDSIKALSVIHQHLLTTNSFADKGWLFR
ncbi:Aspartate/glutamate/uridylate kinase [Protomyces lactucae-debilis]|uniref:Aspartokinase n=1 Tax=Protomyces lactucae-debilis TaxID=2754530 RepID=A0A1Y2FF60_PROLT|nr:Aspartate/glutamate/uridylate kinase [Protomyces lactucae-debilis]ORY81465.1 Aspartate/glutamate/uridylate kinase [Protomyces lactucae-debilis]